MVNSNIFYFLVLTCICCLLLALPLRSVVADEVADLSFILDVNPISTPNSEEIIRFNPNEASELKFAATGMIRLYQKFVSSQDSPSCNFTPSCSRFGMGCIQEYGVFRGILLAADRLLRCNGTPSSHYHLDLRTNKYSDPITDYEN